MFCLDNCVQNLTLVSLYLNTCLQCNGRRRITYSAEVDGNTLAQCLAAFTARRCLAHCSYLWRLYELLVSTLWCSQLQLTVYWRIYLAAAVAGSSRRVRVSTGRLTFWYLSVLLAMLCIISTSLLLNCIHLETPKVNHSYT